MPSLRKRRRSFLPYFYVLCLACVLALSRRGQLLAVAERGGVFAWALAFAAVGIFVTDPLPWVSLLRYNRDNFHVLAAGAFCYLSTFVFRGEAPGRPLFAVGGCCSRA